MPTLVKPDIQGSVGYRPVPPSHVKGRAQTHYRVSALDISPQGMPNHGARLDSPSSPADMSRQVMRRTPSPPPSIDEDSLVNPSVTSPPIVVNQSQVGNVGFSVHDIPLRQEDVNVTNEREDWTQNKDS